MMVAKRGIFFQKNGSPWINCFGKIELFSFEKCFPLKKVSSIKNGVLSIFFRYLNNKMYFCIFFLLNLLTNYRVKTLIFI